MTRTTKIYISLGAVVLIVLVTLGTFLWSDHRQARLEREIETARNNAEEIEANARTLEQKAAEYKRKIDYLEESLSALRLIAKKQDEELKLLEAGTDNARHNVSRSRAVQRIESTAAELCAKLAELGHPCE